MEQRFKKIDGEWFEHMGGKWDEPGLICFGPLGRELSDALDLEAKYPETPMSSDD